MRSTELLPIRPIVESPIEIAEHLRVSASKRQASPKQSPARKIDITTFFP
jgi:hypothetical protein